MAAYLQSIARKAYDIPDFATQHFLSHALHIAVIRDGAICLLVGVNIAVLSGLVENVKTRVFRTAPPPKITPTRLLGMTIGVLTIFCGIYMLAVNVSRAWQYTYGTDPTDLHPLYKEPTTLDRQRANKTLAKLQECPAAKDLLEKVRQAGKISIRIRSDNEASAVSDWNYETRTISLQNSTPDEQKVSYALFELCNERQSYVFKGVTDAGLAGDLSVVQYVEKRVKAEWPSLNCHHDIATRCGWNETLDHFREECQWKSAEEFWTEIQNDPRFKNYLDHYTQQWLTFYQNFYCKRQPDPHRCRKTFTHIQAKNPPRRP